MTVDFSIPNETTALIEPLLPTLYPVRIDLQHHQLKHRISTRDSDVIYYCSSHEIYALHLKTAKRELVKSLLWPPQCLDAGYGWICAGGPEKGQCAFIRVNSDTPSRWSSTSQQPAAVDDLLPLDLDPNSRSLANHDFHWRNYPAGQTPKYILDYHDLGSEIVNSVSIHCMKSDRKGIEDDVIVLATNNDKAVRIFSLSQNKTLASLHFPTCMNHASMSPDSEFLLAVGDEPRAFFHRRVLFENVSISGDKKFATYGWQTHAEPRLAKTPSKDACFSTSFSPSGHVCAVASQSGVITVYDLARITHDMEADDAVICTLKTSRSSAWSTTCGAVRSLDFSPAPWDLLVWAEDQGQVSIIDLRDPPVSKQTIELTTEPSAVHIASLEEHNNTAEQRQIEIERRFIDSHRAALEAQDHLAAVANTADYMDYAVSQRTRRNGDNLIDEASMRQDDPHRLTESERRMIDSIGLRRSRLSEDLSMSSTTTPISVTYTPSSNRSAMDGLYSTNVPSASPLSTNVASGNTQPRSMASIADYMRQRNLERAMNNERSHQPRRRPSVVISNSNNNSSNHTDDSNHSADHSASTSSLAPIGTTAVTLSASPSRLSSNSTPATDSAQGTAPDTSQLGPIPPATAAIGGGDPWQTITDAFTSTYTDPPHPSSAYRSRRTPTSGRTNQENQAPVITSNVYERLRDHINARGSPAMQQLMARNERQRSQTANNVQRLRQLQNAMAVQGRELPTALFEVLEGEVQSLTNGQSREGGLRVMGVGWSVDGRSLYVGTEDGILEYSVNVRQRMQWPATSCL